MWRRRLPHRLPRGFGLSPRRALLVVADSRRGLSPAGLGGAQRVPGVVSGDLGLAAGAKEWRRQLGAQNRVVVGRRSDLGGPENDPGPPVQWFSMESPRLFAISNVAADPDRL